MNICMKCSSHILLTLLELTFVYQSIRAPTKLPFELLISDVIQNY